MIGKIRGKSPRLDKAAFIAPTAVILGDVSVEEKCTIWFGAVIRAEDAPVIIGEGTNIQDNAVLHVDKDLPMKIGKGVTVGHGAILHGCTIGNNCVIGMGSIVMNNAVIGDNSIVGAGTVVTEYKKFPPLSLIVGNPGKKFRELTEEQGEMLKRGALHYAALGEEYRTSLKTEL